MTLVVSGLTWALARKTGTLPLHLLIFVVLLMVATIASSISWYRQRRGREKRR